VTAQPALLAHHCEEAGLTEKVIAYWLGAGRQAWGRSATAEAVALLHGGLALVPALSDSDWRRETELDLRIALGQALTASRGWSAPELGEVYSRARELALTVNRPSALLFALWAQFSDYLNRADLQRARRLAMELLDLGDTAGDAPMQVMGCDAGACTCFHLGEFTTSGTYLEKGLSLFNPGQRPSYSGLLAHDMLVLFQVHSAWQLACLGHLDQALFQRDAALDEARRLSHPPTLALSLVAIWFTGSFVRLEPGSLLQCADELLALAAEHGLGFYRMAALVLRGWCLAALGRVDEGVSLISAGLAGSEEIGFMAWRPFFLTRLGDACWMAGQRHAALEHFAAAQRLAEETEARWFQAETLRLAGEVLLATGDSTAAEDSYREAIAIAQQQSAKLWELRVVTSLAQLWRDQGKRVEAHKLLASVYSWFTEGLGTPVLKEAKALLDALA
jgi:tetratricopeptide (TPR) repeat protein